MASNAPQDCCTQGVKFEGTPVGSLIDVESISTYATGNKSSSKVLLLLTDVLGHKFNNAQLVADAYSREGYYVLVPDIFNGDPTELGKGIPEGWLDRHNVETTEPIIKKVLSYIKTELKPKTIASIGYCFGARYVIRLLGEGAIDVGAGAHPSFVQLPELEKIKKPLIILAAETDQIFTPELRAQSEDVLLKNKATYHITLSSGVSHGFTVRAGDKWSLIMANKAFRDSVWWFKLFE